MPGLINKRTRLCTVPRLTYLQEYLVGIDFSNEFVVSTVGVWVIPLLLMQGGNNWYERIEKDGRPLIMTEGYNRQYTG